MSLATTRQTPECFPSTTDDFRSLPHPPAAILTLGPPVLLQNPSSSPKLLPNQHFGVSAFLISKSPQIVSRRSISAPLSSFYSTLLLLETVEFGGCIHCASNDRRTQVHPRFAALYSSSTMAMAVVGGVALAGRVTTELTMAATSLTKPVVLLSSSSALSFLPSKLNVRPSSQVGSGRRRGFVSMSVSVGAEATATSDTAFADYKASTAFLFPGQGAQAVGMGSEAHTIPAAAALYAKATEILGYDLLDVSINGPKEKLNSTVVSQPAIYVASLAAVEALRAQEKGQAIIDSVDVTCGLSLGEYTALAFAGAFSFEDGLKLVKLRGEAMQAAADATPSAMVSVIGLDSGKVAELCEAANAEVSVEERVQIANFLCPGNYAVSGGVKGVEAVEAKAKSFKARMCVRLAVAGAFHTRFMGPAVQQLEAALANTEIRTPRIPVISNVDAEPHSDPATIKRILAQQVTSPVQWETTLKTLLGKGLQSSYELGPGKVIAGIVKRIDKKSPVENISV